MGRFRAVSEQEGQMKVYMSADLEGITDVVGATRCWPGTSGSQLL